MAERARVREDLVRGIAAPPPDEPASATPDPAAGRDRRRGFALGAIVALVAIVAVLVVRSGTPSDEPLPATGHLGGRLLYATPDPNAEGWVRLWVWNLEDGTIAPGPRARDPISLTDASGAGEGWVGVVSRGDGDTQEASLLRFLEPSDSALPRLTGDFASWAPGGRMASAVRSAEVPGDACPKMVIESYVAVDSVVTELFSGRTCDEIMGLSRAPTYPVLWVRGGLDRDEIDLIGPRGPIFQLTGYALLGTTASHDLLALDADRALVGMPFPPAEGRGWPKPYGEGPDRLSVERLLGYGWAGDSAYILGTYRSERGVYRVFGAGEADARVPDLIVATTGADVAVTETKEGVPILLVDGRLYAVEGGEPWNLEVPEGGPTPGGPILWLTLPEEGER